MSDFTVLSSMQIPDEVAFYMNYTWVTWWDILLFAGVVGFFLFSIVLLKRSGFDKTSVNNISMIVLLFGLLGSRIYMLVSNVFYYDFSLHSLLLLSSTTFHAFAFIAGAFAGLLYYALRNRELFFRLTDAFVPGLIVFRMFELWGTFFRGIGAGGIVTNRALQWFPFAVKVSWYGGPALICYAVFFYEFLWCAALLVYAFYKRKHARFSGDVTLWIGMLLSAGTVFFDLFREFKSYLLMGVAASTIVSFVAFLAALYLISFQKRLGRLPYQPVPDESGEA